MTTMTCPRPMCSFPAGSRVCVKSLCACTKAKCRLCALGLTPGTEVLVLDGGHGGCCRLRVRGADVVLDPSLASEVLALDTAPAAPATEA